MFRATFKYQQKLSSLAEIYVTHSVSETRNSPLVSWLKRYL